MVVDALAEGFLGLQFAPIKAQSTFAKIEMKQGESVQLDLQGIGVADSARILQVNYTPFGGDIDGGMLWPLEVLAPDREVLSGRPLILFPMPFGDPLPASQSVQVLIVWVDQSTMTPAEAALLTAAEALHGGHEPEALVSAATAVELSVEPLLAEFLERFASRGPTSDLLRRASLAGQSEVLLPMACSMLGLPALPDAPVHGLAQLRKLRNQAAHKGQISEATSRKAVAESVASAIFLVEHVRLLEGLGLAPPGQLANISLSPVGSRRGFRPD